jgi:hypothetical protein
MKCAWILAGLALAVTLPAQDFEAKVRDLVKQYGRGTDEELRLRLIDIGDQDSVIRRYDFDRLTEAQQRMITEQIKAADRLTSAQLKEIVAEKGWPTIKMVGVQACEDAIRVLVHSPDREFQKSLADKLEKLANAGEILGTNLAPMIDTLLRSEGKPQRYGTQFTAKGAKATIDPVEDPEKLDERRAAWLLPPMSEYKRDLMGLYRLQVE